MSMIFDDKLAKVKKDLEDFEQAATRMPSMAQFNSVLNQTFPYLSTWRKEPKATLPGFSDIMETLELEVSQGSTLLQVLNYLSGQGAQMLTPVYEFRQGGKTFPVSPSEALTVMDGGEFLCPETRVPVSDPKSKIFLGFRFND